ncbi:MAG: Z1 domain-containing protein [Alphaproteobacteria bacterium]
MTSTSEETLQKVVKFVQELLLDEEDRSAITPALIAEKMDMVIRMNPKWGEGLDREAVVDELIRRFSLWIGQDTTLKSDAGHEPWLVAARRKDWRYWRRYREWLERGLSYKAVDGLDRSTDEVLGLLEDPMRDGAWDRRGLVVGHVQSGKTAHYTGLICKAADAGYKIIIVLAGLHNNLRSQTQMRLEEGFLGYETSPTRDALNVIGVGELDSDGNIHPNCATNRANSGDFNTRISRQLAISPEERPWLFVVKKNRTVLKLLLKWVQERVADAPLPTTDIGGDAGGLPGVRRRVTRLPLLVIDDEADHASVDTGEQLFDADGRPDEDHEPRTINRLIRRLLHSFSRSAYVGYTATPFANIFIHERGETRQEGMDLYPAAFIINLAAPSSYIGPARVFGLLNDGGREAGLPLLRSVDDQVTQDGLGGWMPQKHRNGHSPLHEGRDELPPSLVQAIDAFVLACAVRHLRGQANRHSSMLIHVTRFNSVQRAVHDQVAERVRHLRQRLTRGIGADQILENLRRLWETDHAPTTAAMRDRHPDLVPQDEIGWTDVERVLPDIVSDIHVRMINGTAKDTLDYAEHVGAGLKVIAIGGDKLARGLTLEGLCVSYFLRASRMYDTLMQMGRWFGYRPGYLDLCRLYTTTELVDWFGHIADAAEELREEFDLMAASGATPREYGLKVQSHPVLMVTSRLKMRAARKLMLSFSGHLLETVALFRTPADLNKNFLAARRFISALGEPECDPLRVRNGSRRQWKGWLWEHVPAADIMDFLGTYRTHPEAHKMDGRLLADFIRSMVSGGELTDWTVALIGGDKGRPIELRDGVSIAMLERAAQGRYPDRYSISRLVTYHDEAIDLDEAAWNAALATTRAAFHADPARNQTAKEPDAPNGPAIRKTRGFGADGVPAHPERGVLFLYALDPLLAGPDAGFSEDTPPVIAFGISFPGSNSGLKVEYMVDNVFWEQEYGSSE